MCTCSRVGLVHVFNQYQFSRKGFGWGIDFIDYGRVGLGLSGWGRVRYGRVGYGTAWAVRCDAVQ